MCKQIVSWLSRYEKMTKEDESCTHLCGGSNALKYVKGGHKHSILCGSPVKKATIIRSWSKSSFSRLRKRSGMVRLLCEFEGDRLL